MSKAKAQRRHAQRRARGRYGVHLNRADLDAMVRQIQAGKATFLRRQSGRVSLFAVDMQGLRVPVVYDRKRKTIVTVLPIVALDPTAIKPRLSDV